MTSSSESNSTTDSAPPSSGASTIAGGSSAKGLTSSSQCRVNSSNFFGSPESESRCCCTKCRMGTQVATSDHACEASNSPQIVFPSATLKPDLPTEQTPPAKRARVEGDVDTSRNSNNKKKRKFSSILKGMMSPTVKSVDIEKERDALRRGLGGGNFDKVAKI